MNIDSNSILGGVAPNVYISQISLYSESIGGLKYKLGYDDPHIQGNKFENEILPPMAGLQTKLTSDMRVELKLIIKEKFTSNNKLHFLTVQSF